MYVIYISHIKLVPISFENGSETSGEHPTYEYKRKRIQLRLLMLQL